MIRYDVTFGELDRLIDAESPTWRSNAAHYVQDMRNDGNGWTGDHGNGSWSAIKDVYMKLQNHKCGFCERNP